MLKKRVLLVALVHLMALVLLAVPTAFATYYGAVAPISLYATLNGGTGLYTGNVGGTVTLAISPNNGGSYGVSSEKLELTLPSTVSINKISRGVLNGNTITSFSGSSVDVVLNMKNPSQRFVNGQYRADALRIRYSVMNNFGNTTQQNAYLDIAVRDQNDTSSTAVGSNASVYPNYNYNYNGYYYNNGYYNNGYYNNGYYYNGYYGSYTTTNPGISYGSNGFWAGGKYYPYGSYYNGYYYYGNNQYYTYNPYNTLNNVYGLSLDQSNITLGVGSSQQLQIRVGAYGSLNGISWSSSNAQVAAVDSSGLVTGLTNGTATITARGTYGTTATCTVNVGYGNSVAQGVPSVVPPVSANAQVTSLKFGKVNSKLSVGEAVQMYINIKPSDINYGDTQIVSTDTSVLQVLEGGIVTAVGPGTASVYFAFGGKTAMQTFKVK